MKSKDVELCESLATALVALRKARDTVGYAVVEGQLQANTLDLDSLIENLKTIALVAHNTVIDNCPDPSANDEKLQLNGRAKRISSVIDVIDTPGLGTIAHPLAEDIRKNQETQSLLLIATPILASLIQSDATTCTLDDLVPPFDLVDLTMLYVNSLVAAVRKDIDARTLSNEN